MSECVIIDVTSIADWSPHHSGGVVLADPRRPKVLHESRQIAEREARRLAVVHPGHRFVVFEAVAVGMTIEVATYVNLHGKVLEMGKTAAVVQILGSDDVPF